MSYEEDINLIWTMKLSSSFSKIQRKISIDTGKWLKAPNFSISHSVMKWGSWHPKTRIMTFSENLLRHYEWGAVEHVMKHEVAHQIVSEIFDMDCYGVAHGDAWKRACVMVDIEAKRCNSADFLSKFKGTDVHPSVDKIRKLMAAAASDSGSTEAEAETALKKAQEIMIRYNISMMDVAGEEKVFVVRPFGPNFKSFPAWLWGLGDFLGNQYQVKNIRTWGPNGTKRLELFGEPDRLDIAEYIGHAILNQGKLLFLQHKKEHNARMKTDENYYRLNTFEKWDEKNGGYKRVAHRLSERAFMEGLISGYSQKLAMNRDTIKSKIESEDGAIVPTYDHKLLQEMYGKSYPNLLNHKSAFSRGQGREAGREAGHNLRISKGVTQGGNRGRLLS